MTITIATSTTTTTATTTTSTTTTATTTTTTTTRSGEGQPCQKFRRRRHYCFSLATSKHVSREHPQNTPAGRRTLLKIKISTYNP